uniref:Snaclec A11 n=1 Tax=Macrovipera lebetinus TaxID=3148341 RepID=SLAB_MACLB|nr:RecName: Full=Snaclec A11; AltName: Full=C-type lectin A11; Flags: Precursor [Macrovipera lebetina]ABW82658.1 c-type lectin [Macrovipera lebetina]
MGRSISVSFGLLVVFLSLSGTGADFDCPSGWSAYDQHCYQAVDEPKSWADAEKFCTEQANGGHLVSIDSKKEANFVAELVSQNIKETRRTDFVWIGLRVEDKRQQCSSEWSDGSSINYQNWIEAESKKCLGLEKQTRYRKWVNLNCGQPYRFTCEI